MFLECAKKAKYTAKIHVGIGGISNPKLQKCEVDMLITRLPGCSDSLTGKYNFTLRCVFLFRELAYA